MQFHVLVVDDEPFIADTIAALLQAQKDLQLEVHVAYRSEQALSILDKNRIDLLVSDICMPELDGLQLLDLVNRSWPACRTIFLTGYADFSYVYAAMQKHAASYVLKSEEDEVLLGRVRDTLVEIEKNLKSAAELPSPVSPAIEERVSRLFASILSSGQDALLADALPLMGFPTPCRDLTLLLCAAPEAFTEASAQRLEAITAHFLGELCEGLLRVARPDERSMVYLCRFTSRPSHVWLSGILETIQNACSVSEQRDVSFLVSPLAPNAANFCAVYRSLLALYEEKQPQSGTIPFIYMPALSIEPDASDNLIDFLRSYIVAHAREDLSVAQLSLVSGYNSDYLSRLFRQATGQTLGRFISQARLDYIRQLMANPDASLDYVSRQASFSSRSYFNRFVKRETGLTPQQLQNQLLGRSLDDE